MKVDIKSSKPSSDSWFDMMFNKISLISFEKKWAEFETEDGKPYAEAVYSAKEVHDLLNDLKDDLYFMREAVKDEQRRLVNVDDNYFGPGY